MGLDNQVQSDFIEIYFVLFFGLPQNYDSH